MNGERRLDENKLLRRLVLTGSLLAEAVRGMHPDSALPGALLASLWDRLVEELREERARRHAAVRAAIVPRAEGTERIGTCEICGTIDHHLVDGVCPDCRPRCRETSPPEPAASQPTGGLPAMFAGCATHADNDGTGYCVGCGTTIGEPHHAECECR